MNTLSAVTESRITPLPVASSFIVTYSAIATPPIARVEVVGVRKRLWTLAKADGMALYTAIDSVVRAVGRIVVCVDAAAELRIIKKSRWIITFPKPELPK